MSANELKSLLENRNECMSALRDIKELHERSVASLNVLLLEALEAIADHVEGSAPKPAQKKRPKPNTRRPDHDATAKRYADLEPCSTGCLCGCGEHVDDGVNFVKGHQKRLQSIALAVEAGKMMHFRLSPGGKNYAILQGWMTDRFEGIDD